MPSQQHEVYRTHVHDWIQAHREDPSVRASIEAYGEAALVLWHLDLEPARVILMQGYAENPRGSTPRDPIPTLRSLLLSIVLKQPSINDWVEKDLRGSVVLQVLCGFKEGDIPGVGTFYDFMHRLHDGPQRKGCPHTQPPSVLERQRAQSPRVPLEEEPAPPQKKKKRCKKKSKRGKGKTDAEATPPDKGVTAQLVSTLRECQTQPNPNDILTRLGQLLIVVAVNVSGQ